MIHRVSLLARSVAFVLLAIVPAAGLLPGSATAAAKPTNAIRVSPALSNIQLAAGETSKTINTEVYNLTSSPLTVGLSARDFGASATSSGRVSFYGNSYNPATNPHGLQTAVSFASPSITLAPKSSQQVAIILNNVDKLAPGGHYGAIMFSPEPLAAVGSRQKVSVHSAVASLVFLTTASGGTQTLQLLPMSIGPLRFTLPGTSYVAFKDTGNTQSDPQGQLTLYGPGGTIVGTTVLNPGSGLILPGTSRPFTANLPLQHTWLAWPGMYRLELQYRAPSQAKFTVVNERFLFINPAMLVLLILLLLVVIYLAKRYGRRLFRLARRGLSAVKRLLSRKPTPEEPPKPKRKRPLVQG